MRDVMFRATSARLFSNRVHDVRTKLYTILDEFVTAQEDDDLEEDYKLLEGRDHYVPIGDAVKLVSPFVDESDLAMVQTQLESKERIHIPDILEAAREYVRGDASRLKTLLLILVAYTEDDAYEPLVELLGLHDGILTVGSRKPRKRPPATSVQPVPPPVVRTNPVKDFASRVVKKLRSERDECRTSLKTTQAAHVEDLQEILTDLTQLSLAL